jgi:hypothetical protein
MPDEHGNGVTRRDLLKKGVALGGTALWVTPAVQVLGVSRAYAQTASPPPPPDGCDPNISYIAINLQCSSGCLYFKFEYEDGEWVEDNGYGQVEEHCPGFDPCDKAREGLGKISVTGSNESATITVIADGCVLEDVAVKGGQVCQVYSDLDKESLTVRCPTTVG